MTYVSILHVTPTLVYILFSLIKKYRFVLFILTLVCSVSKPRKEEKSDYLNTRSSSCLAVLDPAVCFFFSVYLVGLLIFDLSTLIMKLKFFPQCTMN